MESGAYPDPEAGNVRFVVLEISPLRRLSQPPGLDRTKASGQFEGWELVPVPEEHWHRIIEMSEP